MKYVYSFFCFLFMMNSLSHAQQRGSFNYDQAWKRVEQLSNKANLPKSALEEVEKIYTAALAEQNDPQQVKAIRYRVDLLYRLDNSWISSIQSLRKQAAALSFPAQAIVQSFLAEAYLSYYSSNYFQFQTTPVETILSDDVAIWDKTTMLSEILRAVHLSLSNAKGLQSIATQKYELLLEGDKSLLALRPTLYDFMITRTIDLFASDPSYSARRSQQTFTYNNKAYFSEVSTFVQTPLLPADTLSLTYQALKLTQEHLAFRLSRQELDPLLDADLNRLKLVRFKSTLENKDELYEQALVRLIKAGDRSKLLAGDLKYELATHYYEQGEDFRRTNLYRNRIASALSLCNEIEAKCKQSKAYQDNAYMKTLRKKILAPSIDLTVENYNLPNEASKILLKYRNTEMVYLSVVRLENVSKNKLDQLEKTWKTLIINNKTVQQQVVKTVHQADHQRYTAEFVVGPLPIGNYLVVASNSKQAKDKDAEVDIQRFQVTDISIITSSEPVLYLRERKSGLPIAHASVNAYEKEGKGEVKLLASFTSNDAGELPIDKKLQEKIRSIQSLEITTKENGKQFFDMNWYYWNQDRSKESVSQKMLFFTDRTIYRPGQTLYFKGVLYTEKQVDSPLAANGKKVKVGLCDVNRQEVASLELITNEYGSVQGSFVLPKGLLNGQMSLETNYGSHYFSMEEYKRPTFEVSLQELKCEVALGSKVLVEGMANAFAGYAIDGAKVSYRVIRRTEPLYRYWFFPPIRTAEREIASGKTMTDATGAFKVPFTAKADDLGNDPRVYHYVVTADVTDSSGETHSTSYTIRVARKPLLIEASIPDRIAASEALRFDLKTVNLNGQAVSCQVKVNIRRLQAPTRVTRKSQWEKPDTFLLARAEFERMLPYDAYTGDENRPDLFPTVQQLPTIQFRTDDSAQLDLSLLKSQPSAWYALGIEATSESGLLVERTYYAQLINGMPAPIIQAEDWLHASASKAKPGEEVLVWLAGSSENSQIDYVLYGQKGQELEKKQLKVGRTPQPFTIHIKEEYRGGVSAQFSMVQNNRFYTQTVLVEVPWDNKMLDIEWRSFRKQLQPGQAEKWSLVVRDHRQRPAMAELVATLYDASLDAFRPYSWKAMAGMIHRQNFDVPMRSDHGRNVYMRGLSMEPFFNYRALSRDYPTMVPAWDSRGIERQARIEDKQYGARSLKGMASVAVMESQKIGLDDMADVNVTDGAPMMAGSSTNEVVTPRTNFNETAFFFPELRTNEQGEVEMEFVLPQSLTQWKMMGFAHTRALQVGATERTLVTCKEVAITAHAPRFFRQGDTIVLTARVNNSADKDLQATASLQLHDPLSGKELIGLILSPTAQQVGLLKAQSGVVAWKLFIPPNLQALTYRVTAKAGQHTDGEEHTAPVLPNNQLVTETMPFMVRGGEQKSFTFDRLKNHASSTLWHQALTLEFTSNPAWYAMQALPSLMDYPYDCSEQIFSQYFANSLALKVFNSNPRVKQVFDVWRTNPDSKSLRSNLEKNQELKQALLEETPWVMEAKEEDERKKRVGLLFDLNRMGSEQQKALNQLSERQKPNGAFPWFDGMNDSRFITQHIVVGLSQLQHLGAIDTKNKNQVAKIIQAGQGYCDTEIGRDFYLLADNKIDMNQQHVRVEHLQSLYACSFSKHIPADKKLARAYLYYADQATRYWTSFGLYEQGLIALWAHRTERGRLANDIVKSLREHAQQSDQTGMYWNRAARGYYWYQAPIETQALMAEVFHEVAKDAESVEEIKAWLLLNKQTTDWRTTKATAAACYALLMTGDNLLDYKPLLNVKVGGKLAVPNAESKQEAGTGYVKTSWIGAEITPKMADVEVKNPHSGLAWGAMYWQYFERLDKITSNEANMKVNRRLFVKTMTDKGPVLAPLTAQHPLRVGELVTVRMELRADRDFEYVHLKDARAAGFEPVNTLSGYCLSAGLGYYQNSKDASMNFFMDRMPKGTYVLEYDLRVTHQGNFSNGVSTLQCMYAPEFSAHSEGVSVRVE